MTSTSKRLTSVDLMRFFAIFLMFVDHAIKLFYNFIPTTTVGNAYVELAKNLLLITTFSAPLFLFLVGMSAVLSFNKKGVNNRSKWLNKKIKRGAFFIVVSFPLYFYQEGFSEIPYTSGVLQLIGTSLIIISIILVVVKRHRTPLFLSLAVLSLLVGSYLRSINFVLPVISKVNFPILPFIAYVFAGSFIADVYLNAKNKTLFIKTTAFSSLFVMLFFLYFSGFDPLAIPATYDVIENYIIHSYIMVIFYSSLMTLIFSTLMSIEKILKNNYIGIQAGLIGKEALNIYILHILLGWGVSKYILGDQKFGFWAPVLAILIFTAIGWIWAKSRQKGYFQI